MTFLENCIKKLDNVKLNKDEQHEWVEVKDFIDRDDITKIVSEINHLKDKEELSWIKYNTPIENKMTNNNWNDFSESLYTLFSSLNDSNFVKQISKIFGVELIPDNGLHGGGIHLSSAGGRLDPHLDYAIHPKLNKLRYVNAILFLTSQNIDFKGGSLGFWHRMSENINPAFGEPAHKIIPEAGKLVLFNVSGYSWHGLCEDVSNGLRISLATYYLTEIKNKKYKTNRSAAVFSATSEREINEKVIDAQNKRLVKAGLKANE